MIIDYQRIEEYLNKYANFILKQIELDYQKALSEEQKEFLNRLENDTSLIKVNQPSKEDIAFFSKQAGKIDEKDFSAEYIPSAHGGRTKHDDKIHIYPYTKSFEKCHNNEEIIKMCVQDIIVHELFHFFIRPDATKSKDMQSFLTEGFVQDYTIKFSERHDLPVPKSNYIENVTSVKKIQEGFSDNLTREQKDKIIFQNSIEDILSCSKNGQSVLQDYRENQEFKQKITALVQESTICLGLSQLQVDRLISFYKRNDNKTQVIADLYNKFNEYFNNDLIRRDYFLEKLRGIDNEEYQKINLTHKINEEKVDLIIQKEKLKSQKEENLQKFLTNHGYISSIIYLLVTLITGITIAILLIR